MSTVSTTSTVTTASRSATSAGTTLAAALAPYDPDRTRAALHPDARIRITNPGGIEDYETAEALISAFTDWMAAYDAVEATAVEVLPFADIARVRLGYALRQGEESTVMELALYVTEVTDGRVSGIAGACSAPRQAGRA